MQERAIIYTRVSSEVELNADDQRNEILARVGDTHEFVREFRETSSGDHAERPAFKQLLEDAAKGNFDVLLCTDLTRLSRQVTPEIILALKKAGVRVVTADGGEVGIAELVVADASRTFVDDQKRSAN